MPPNTSVPVPAKLKSEDCDKCEPDATLLIGPPRAVTNSAVFDVTDEPVVLRAYGLKPFPGATITLQMQLSYCGDEQFETICCMGEPITLTAENNVRTLEAAGRYRVVLAGAEPDDLWVTQNTTAVGTGLGLGTRKEKG